MITPEAEGAAALNGAERDRLHRAFDPLETERLAREWGAQIEQKRGEAVLAKEMPR